VSLLIEKNLRKSQRPVKEPATSGDGIGMSE
jgi:hypothetical protein